MSASTAPPDGTPSLISRRSVLGLAGAAAAGIVVGSAGRAQAHNTYGTLIYRSEIWWQSTHYYNGSVDNSRSPYSFWYNPYTYAQAEKWLEFYYLQTPTTWVAPMHLWLNGVHVDKPGMHSYGRAIDLQYVYMTINGGLQQVFNADYRWWKNQSNVTTYRKRYWALVASLNYYFDYVLHYWFTPDRFSSAKDYSHEYHVHFDDDRSGLGALSVFKGTSGRDVQTYTVQSCLVFIWGISLPRYGIDGYWGSETDNAVRLALSRIGRTGTITTASNWRAFLQESARAGTRNYIP